MPPSEILCHRCERPTRINEEATAIICAGCSIHFIGFRREGDPRRGITDGYRHVYWPDANGTYIRDPQLPAFVTNRPRDPKPAVDTERVRNSPKNRELHLARKRVREELAAKGAVLSSALRRTFDEMDAAELAAEERAKQELRKHGL